jgi:hypothetical protein
MAPLLASRRTNPFARDSRFKEGSRDVASSAFSGHEDEWEWRHKPGRLLEDSGVEERFVAKLFGGRARRFASSGFSAPAAAATRPISREGRVAIHFRHAAISKIPSVSASAGRPGRVYLYPSRAQVKALKAAGAGRERSTGRYWVADDRLAQLSPRLQQLATGAARQRWEARRQAGRTGTRMPGGAVGRKTGTPAARSAGLPAPQVFRCQPGTASRYQRYIERADLEPEERRKALVTDDLGHVSFGSLGASEIERAQFWMRVEERERSDGRVQCQLIAEVPHELGADAVRRVAEAIAEPLLERGLPYHVAAHWPEVDHGADSRNVHLHVVYSDRPARRVDEFEWEMAPRKDREARDAAWIVGWRERYVEALNVELERAGAVKRYDARNYEEMGIDKVPTVHLGPAKTSRERAGEPTRAGVANAEAETGFRGAGGGDRLIDGPLAARGRRAIAAVPDAPGFGEARRVVEVRQRIEEWAQAVGDEFDARERWARMTPWHRLEVRRRWIELERTRCREPGRLEALDRLRADADREWRSWALRDRAGEMAARAVLEELQRRTGEVGRATQRLGLAVEALERESAVARLGEAVTAREVARRLVGQDDREGEAAWMERLAEARRRRERQERDEADARAAVGAAVVRLIGVEGAERAMPGLERLVGGREVRPEDLVPVLLESRSPGSPVVRLAGAARVRAGAGELAVLVRAWGERVGARDRAVAQHVELQAIDRDPARRGERVLAWNEAAAAARRVADADRQVKFAADGVLAVPGADREAAARGLGEVVARRRAELERDVMADRGR